MSRSAEMLTHKDLDIWKKGIDLVENAYKLTAHFPKEEIYGLVTQIRRVAISIPNNIAEGAARNSTKEMIQFLYIALGSLSELKGWNHTNILFRAEAVKECSPACRQTGMFLKINT